VVKWLRSFIFNHNNIYRSILSIFFKPFKVFTVILFTNSLLLKKKFLDVGFYAYFNMDRHYICHYFTPSDSIEPGIRELFRF